jgi:hypothetical protein
VSVKKFETAAMLGCKDDMRDVEAFYDTLTRLKSLFTDKLMNYHESITVMKIL